MRIVARIFVWILGSKRRHFATAIKYKNENYIITVEKYRLVKELCSK